MSIIGKTIEWGTQGDIGVVLDKIRIYSGLDNGSVTGYLTKTNNSVHIVNPHKIRKIR